MKNFLRRARPVVVRGCDAELYAASAKEKAIACLSTDVRPRCNSKARSDGITRAQRKIRGIPAECLARLSGHLSHAQREQSAAYDVGNSIPCLGADKCPLADSRQLSLPLPSSSEP